MQSQFAKSKIVWILFKKLSVFYNFYNFPGVVNVIHGQHDAVNFICDHPDIRAISFVGGDVAGK